MIPFCRARDLLNLACLLLAATSLANASTTEADDASTAQVEVSSLRAPAAIPYKLAYHLMRAVAQTGEPPRVTAHVRLFGADKSPASTLKLRLLGPNTDQPIPVSPTGEVSIPLDEAALNDGAEIVSNKKKGALKASIALQPHFTTTPVRYRDLVATIHSARQVRDEILPWYLRLVLPTVNAINVCFAGTDQAVTVHAATDVRRIADRIDTEDDVALHCARFAANESDIATDAELITPPGVTYRFAM